MKPQIRWLRVFVEGVVIVGSSLLAFGLQAWWEGGLLIAMTPEPSYFLNSTNPGHMLIKERVRCVKVG